MKNTKRCFCRFSYYDQQGIQAELENMAERGWMPEKLGSILWTYKRMEPKKLRFSVTYFPNASDFDPGLTDGELTKIDYCRQDGWNLAARWGFMQIFYNENAGAVPIETDPVTQVENICRSIKKSVLFPRAVFSAWLVLMLFKCLSLWRSDPAGELSNPFSLYCFLMFGVLILACLDEIAFYFCWTRKARAAAQNDGVFLPIKTRHAANLIFTAFPMLLTILTYSVLKGLFVVIQLGLLLITVIGNLIKKRLKKRGVSKDVSRVVFSCSMFLMTVLFMVLMTAATTQGRLHIGSEKTAAGTYELYGRTREIYNDPLPLEIEELADVAAQWSKEADHQETVLLASTEYLQYAVPVNGNDNVDECKLEYTITEVKQDFLYDSVKSAVLNSRQDEIRNGFVFTGHYEPIDASIWSADDAYQLYWSDSVMNTYLICWGNRIAEIKFYWEPTAEQIAITSEKLKNC